MRILLLSDDFLPRVGGVSHMMDRLAASFIRAGASCAVGAPRLPGPIPERPYPIFWEDRQRGEGRFNRPRRARAFIEGAIEEFKPERLLLGTQFYYAPACLALGRERGIPVGLYTHGMELRRALVEPARPLKSMVARLVGLRTFRDQALHNVAEADFLFANSHYTAGLVRSAGGRVETLVTGCGIDRATLEREVELTPDPDPGLRARRRAELGLGERKTVGFLGRVVPSKNLGGLVEAMARLPEVQLLVAGNGPELPRVQERIAELELGERIRLVGQIDDETKWRYLRCMDVLCLPSIEMPDGPVEGFGIAILEALAAGASVVAGRSGGMADAVANGEAGLLADPHDPDDLARCIGRLIDEPDLARGCVEEGRRRIANQFNWEAIGERVLAHLGEAPQRDSQPAP